MVHLKTDCVLGAAANNELASPILPSMCRLEVLKVDTAPSARQ